MRPLLLGIALTMGMAIFGTWNTWVTYRGFQDIAKVELRLDRLSGTIVYLDEVLTMSARMSASSGDRRWGTRYTHFEPLLDAAIRETVDIAPDEVIRHAAQQLDDANTLLVEMEHTSFDLVKEGRHDDAKALLYSREYEEEKTIYAEAITECKVAVERRVDEQLHRLTHRALIGAAMTLAALVALAFGWASLLRLVRQSDAERVTLLDRLEDAVRARDEFLSIASHELKTPLTTLKLQVESLSARVRKERPGAGGADLLRKLGIAERQVNRLSSLINELLDTSRITSGRMLLMVENDVDLAEIMRETLGRFKEELARASCEVHVHGLEQPILGRWDRLRLDQVLSNLIANALKYGAGSPIEVQAEATELTAGFTIRDHGIGIPLDKQSVIFSRFERAVPEREYGGFGLGLWIVREIALAMGGEVSVASRLGEGAAFHVVLPRCATSATPEGPETR